MTTAASPAALIETHFGALKDPRSPHRIEHKLIDLLIITICATICGANDWEAIAEYGRTKQDWLKTWLELPNGIPSPDTFSRVLARIKPAELQKCFMGWMSAAAKITEGELLNIDGKTLRGAKESGNAKSLIHMVSCDFRHNLAQSSTINWLRNNENTSFQAIDRIEFSIITWH